VYPYLYYQSNPSSFLFSVSVFLGLATTAGAACEGDAFSLMIIVLPAAC